MLLIFDLEGVGNEGKYRLIDIDGKRITPTELTEKYFSSPEDCFIKDDETLNAENMASNIVSVSNHLYSQTIQHKITPPACNNILTELYNNPTEVSSDEYCPTSPQTKNHGYSCYYCSYQTKIIKEYERHVVLKHRNKPAYPGKADMQSLGLSPKGNKWEALGA